MVVDNMQIKLGEVWTCGTRDEHANRQTHVMCKHTWLTGTPYTHHSTPLPYWGRLTIIVTYFRTVLHGFNSNFIKLNKQLFI